MDRLVQQCRALSEEARLKYNLWGLPPFAPANGGFLCPLDSLEPEILEIEAEIGGG